jgi:hypothetical protein
MKLEFFAVVCDILLRIRPQRGTFVVNASLQPSLRLFVFHDHSELHEAASRRCSFGVQGEFLSFFQEFSLIDRIPRNLE